RTSVSTNIKERLDFSCAIFGPDGGLVANAPHLPVHLGSMQEAVRYQTNKLKGDIRRGDVLVSNHPIAGGTHLPDLTVMTPVFHESSKDPVFWVASRGHHADIGGITPGSMPPFSVNLSQEGAAIESLKLVKQGVFMEEEVTHILTTPSDPQSSGTRNLANNISDLKAQIAANQKGITLMENLIEEYSLAVVQAYMYHIQDNAEEAVRNMLKRAAKDYRKEHKSSTSHPSESQEVMLQAVDYMDDGTPIPVAILINEKDGSAVFDFTGAGPMVYGNCNAPRVVTYSAIIYCMRCLVDLDIPLNQGCLKPIRVIIPDNSILSPSPEAAIVGGNVLTSQRVTDVILKAFNACAASQVSLIFICKYYLFV
ncbi:5-oxoprolinase (ATP-hydrolysing), partial [Reticulomyxa filosa]